MNLQEKAAMVEHKIFQFRDLQVVFGINERFIAGGDHNHSSSLRMVCVA
jgi:hypothetical protein